MITATSNRTELLTAIDECIAELQQGFASLDDDEINKIPYPNSWTAGQLMQHVSKSIDGIAGAMKQKGEVAERDAAENAEKLRTIFLDFSNKFQAPDFIVPEEKIYEKQLSTKELTDAFNKLKTNSSDTNLNELIKGLPMGEVTKLELLHFVLYHTQRHLHQMKKIMAALKEQ
jgi:hypothetical protein